MELQRLRDYVLCVLLIYFLIVIGFLYSQAMWLVVYLLAVVRADHRHADSPRRTRCAHRASRCAWPRCCCCRRCRSCSSCICCSPRLQGALLVLPQDAYAGLTGLSEDMRPGSINELFIFR